MAWNNGGDGNGQRRGKFELKENRGSLFENDHKSSDKHPDFTGTLNVNGTLYWISGWTEMKTIKGKDKRYMSLSVKRQEERQPEQGQPQRFQGGRASAKW